MVNLSKVLVKFGLGCPKPGKIFVNLGRVRNTVETWPELVARLSNVHRTPETLAQFLKLPRGGVGGQDALKASAGFWIGCRCTAESRQYANLLPRTLIAFDLDTLTPEGLAYIAANEHPLRDYVWFAHTTRKHTHENPRLRIVVLLSEAVPSELYEPVARFLANLIDRGLKWTDAVSFRPTQLMYLPTASVDNPFETYQSTGSNLVSWKTLFANLKRKGIDAYDVRNWPRKAEEDILRIRTAKAQDPWEKPGLIGAFCRTYPVERLIIEHLSEIYELGSTDGRYTAIGSSTSNGLVVYQDGRFATSYHGTDPIAGQSVNSWDMARICLYGNLDPLGDDATPMTKRPSYKAMVAFARSLTEVQEDMLENALDVSDKFDELVEKNQGEEELIYAAVAKDPYADFTDDEREMLGLLPLRMAGSTGPDLPAMPQGDWKLHLVKDDNAVIENCLPNIITIMRFDPRWSGKVRFNELHERTVITKPIRFKDKPWQDLLVQDEHNGDVIQDFHRATFRAVMESGRGSGRSKNGYGLSSVSQINLTDGIDTAARCHSYHPVKVFLGPVPKWDGKNRLATMLQIYLKVDDSAFVREAFTMMMVAAVARTFEPGHKFDHALIIQGKQGAGKSTFLKYLAKLHWHREFDIGFDDPQKIAEKLMGAVIVEMGELSGMKKAEVEDAKQFMSASETVVRMAYGREPRVFKRRCVIFGTTNDEQPLKDTTGNRRWWVVKSKNEEESGIADLHALAADVDQCWHEAYHIYLQMRAAQPCGDLSLTLSSEARLGATAAAAAAVRESEFMVMAEQIETWADTPATKACIQNGDTSAPLPDDDELVVRSRFTPMQAYTEALGQRQENYARDAWKMASAFNHLRGRWTPTTNRQLLHSVRAKWIYRDGASAEERQTGYMESVPPEEDDLLG